MGSGDPDKLVSGAAGAREARKGAVAGGRMQLRFSISAPCWSDSMPDQPAPSTPPVRPDGLETADEAEDGMVIHGPRLRERLQRPLTGKWQVVAPRCASPEATSLE